VVEYELNYPYLIMITGGIIILTMFVKSGTERTSVPSLVGFLLLGLLLRLADTQWAFLGPDCKEILGFLAELGLVTLLFRVGLESNLDGLLSQLRRASVIWSADVIVSGLTGFASAFYLLGLTWVTSLIVATALTATSVGICVSVWEENNALKSSNGELLMDVAELDDISAVVLMAMLFSVLAALKGNAETHWVQVLPKTIAAFLVKLLLFGGFCFLFSRFVERPVTDYFKNLKSPPDPMLVMVGISFMIAALAALLGFSLAIGAFFAGLVFSRDPRAVKMENSFLPLYELFTPFFFIGIGLAIDPGTIMSALGLGTVLLMAAVAGKFIADGIPIWRMTGLKSGVLIGASMVPRAEIAMVIMHRGLGLGHWAVPAQVYGAMVMVSTATCILSPVMVHALLKRWPQGEAFS